MTTYRTRRTLARRTTALALGLGALGALAGFEREASAAELLICTGTEFDLKAELFADAVGNNLQSFPIIAVDPLADAGRLDDGSVRVMTPIVSQIFPAGIPFINTYNEIYANVNGTITFEAPLPQFTPDAIPGLNQPTIAPFFGDADLRPLNGPAAFTLCVEPANQRLFFTWETTGYYDSHVDRLNSFQVVLTNNDATECPSAANFQVEFRYSGLEWTTGDASGGAGGLGGNEATAGIDAGDDVNAVALPGSGTAAVLNLVSGTNVDDPGVFSFLVAQGTLPDCGNGTPDLCEECDDGNPENGDACTNLCLNAQCGDGLVHDGFEQCDRDQVPGIVCPPGFTGSPLCNNDPANPNGNNTCTVDPIPDGCTDTDECAAGTDNCDDPPEATCTNTPGGFTCACNPGYTGNGFACQDIDECADGTDNCADPPAATCTNLPGTFDCDCNPGFTGDGVTCVPDGTGGGGPGGGGQGGSGNGGGGQGGSGNGGGGQGGSGNGGGGQGGSGNGGGGQGGSGNGGGGQGGSGNGGGGQGGSGNGGSGQGGSGNGGSGQGGGEGPSGPGSSSSTGANGSSGTGANGTTGTAAGPNGSTGSGDGEGGNGDNLDGVLASGGLTCAVQAPGSDGTTGGKGALALLALAGAVVVSRRRR